MPDSRPGARRVWSLPVACWSAVAASWALYELGPPTLADVVIVPYALGLVLAPSIVHPWLRWRSASSGAAVAAALVVPAAWLAKELYRVTGVYSVPEALYYALNPLALGIFGAAALQMALSEIVWRRRREGAWRFGGAPGWTLAVLAALAVAAVAVGHDSGGRDIFYDYVALYRVLFPAS